MKRGVIMPNSTRWAVLIKPFLTRRARIPLIRLLHTALFFFDNSSLRSAHQVRGV